MTMMQKLEEYLRTHKTPVTADELADRYLVSKTHITRTLAELQREGVAAKLGARRPLWSHIDYFR